MPDASQYELVLYRGPCTHLCDRGSICLLSAGPAHAADGGRGPHSLGGRNPGTEAGAMTSLLSLVAALSLQLARVSARGGSHAVGATVSNDVGAMLHSSLVPDVTPELARIKEHRLRPCQARVNSTCGSLRDSCRGAQLRKCPGGSGGCTTEIPGYSVEMVAEHKKCGQDFFLLLKAMNNNYKVDKFQSRRRMALRDEDKCPASCQGYVDCQWDEYLPCIADIEDSDNEFWNRWKELHDETFYESVEDLQRCYAKTLGCRAPGLFTGWKFIFVSVVGSVFVILAVFCCWRSMCRNGGKDGEHGAAEAVRP
jgi:hypothetical protein